jgi:hypothetical protein
MRDTTTHEPERPLDRGRESFPADSAARTDERTSRGASLRARLKQHPVRTAVAALVVVGAGTVVGRVALRLARGAIHRVTGKDAVDLIPSRERPPDPSPAE